MLIYCDIGMGLASNRTPTMTRSELIAALCERFDQLPANDVKTSVEKITEAMSSALAAQQRVEVRGFGSFSINARPPRMGRNPRTGEQVAIPEQRVPHFKPGKKLRQAVQPLTPPARASRQEPSRDT